MVHSMANTTDVTNVTVEMLYAMVVELQQANLAAIQEADDIRTNIDVFFVIVMGCIIYFLQGGFALLEVGSVRAKNATNILMKNILDGAVAGFAYWAIGYAFAYGTDWNGLIGYKYFFSYELPKDMYYHYFFNYVFAATSATIVSGSVAERCGFEAYLIYSFFLTGFIYPVASHWVWSADGWLVGRFHDFAGSGVVHMLGGIAGLTGAVFLGPRIGRFDKDTGKAKRISGHSVPLAVTGAFILFFGFFAFNGGSTYAVATKDSSAKVAGAIIVTGLAATAAAFTTLIVKRIFGDKYWTLLVTLNGSITGMVSVCAGCDVFEPWEGFVTGIIASFSYLFWDWVLIKLKIDDPLNAFPVHAGGGLWGVFAAVIFGKEGVLRNINSTEHWKLFGWQVTGTLAIIAWTGVLCGIMFAILKATKMLRVSEEYEIKGMDIPKHGEPAYPEDAFAHGWGNFYTHDLEGGSALKGLFKRLMLKHLDDDDHDQEFSRGLSTGIATTRAH